MNILAIDASTAVLSLGLRAGKEYFQFDEDRGFRHSELIMNGVDHLVKEARLKPSDIDLICTALGPGSFTGLRVGMASAKGIAAGLGIPLVAVPTLDTLAHSFTFYPGVVLPLIDARKSRFYTALYTNGQRRTGFLDADQNRIFHELKALGGEKRLLLTGPDWGLFEEAVSLLEEGGWTVDRDLDNRRGYARIMTERGRIQFEERGGDPSDTGPLYLRKSEAELSRGQGSTAMVEPADGRQGVIS